MRLFRAVSLLELTDIREQGGAFRDPKDQTDIKGFFFDLFDARKMAASFTQMTGMEHHVVQTEAPDSLVESSKKHDAAQEGPGVYLGVSDLSQLRTAVEV